MRLWIVLHIYSFSSIHLLHLPLARHWTIWFRGKKVWSCLKELTCRRKTLPTMINCDFRDSHRSMGTYRRQHGLHKEMVEEVSTRWRVTVWRVGILCEGCCPRRSSPEGQCTDLLGNFKKFRVDGREMDRGRRWGWRKNWECSCILSGMPFKSSKWRYWLDLILIYKDPLATVGYWSVVVKMEER